MTSIQKAKIDSGTRLLKKLVEKLDVDKDGLLPSREISRATTRATTGDTYVSTLDAVTREALSAAALRAQSGGSTKVVDIKAGIDLARTQILAADTNGDGKIDDTDAHKFARVRLARALLEFARVHSGATVKDFKVVSSSDAGGYTPKHPFHAPRGTAEQVMVALVKHYNSYVNDNFWPGATSRWVLSKHEAQGVADELRKMSPTKGKAVLRALSAAVMSDAVPRPYVAPEGVATLKSLARTMGVASLRFDGVAAPPGFPGY